LDEEEREESDEQPEPQESRSRRDDSRGRQNEPRQNEPRGGRDRQHVHRQPPAPIDREDLETPSLETEAGSEAADPTEAVAGHGQNAQGEEGGPRRRRRRRGRRGRGRNREQGEGQQQPASNGHPLERSDNGTFEREEANVEEAVIEDESGDVVSEDVQVATYDDRPRKHERAERETTAGSEREQHSSDEAAEAREDSANEEAPSKPRRRRRGGRGRGKKAVAAKAESDDSASKSAAASTPPPDAAPEPAIVRTGSTDRHLIEDEPVFSPPARRPRTMRDLDSIPDDFD
jgi:ribonuclease E